MREYEVGDIICIDADIEISERGAQVTSGMTEYAGNKAKIEMILNGADYEKEGPRYILDIDNGLWAWQAFMFSDEQKEKEDDDAYASLFGGESA